MTVGEALKIGIRRLELKGLPSPRRDVEAILTTVLDRGRAFLLAHPEAELTGHELATYESWLGQREDHYPIQYLRGFQEFFGRNFLVRPGVLIPRPETEVLVEAVLEHLKHLRVERVLGADIGTGSGCIAITLACEDRRLEMLATDTSGAALEVAEENARRLGCLPPRVAFVRTDLLPGDTRELDLVVSNPPYVDPAAKAHVDDSVLRHEPAEAVFSGERGFAVYAQIFSRARPALKPSGRLFLELGAGMLDELVSRAGATGWRLEDCLPDLAGKTRCAIFSRG